MDITLWIIILIFLLDISVLYDIIRSKRSQGNKVIYSLIIVLLPIIGVSIYYLVRK